MKSNNRKLSDTEYENDAYEDYMTRDKKNADRRRPIRNWTKVWSDHTNDYDEIDDFYTTKKKRR